MSSSGCDGKPAVVLKAATGRRVELFRLSSRLAYRELAAVLGSATQGHVAANPLLHDVLGLEDMDVRRLPVLCRSPTDSALHALHALCRHVAA